MADSEQKYKRLNGMLFSIATLTPPSRAAALLFTLDSWLIYLFGAANYGDRVSCTARS